MEDTTPVKYVCQKGDLDKLLDSELRSKFQSLFASENGAYRLNWGGLTPAQFLSRFGIDLVHPTVRDAVAFDIVKLDGSDISNDSDYTYQEHLLYSRPEYERYLLNRNFRVQLVNLEPEWTNVTYMDTGDVKKVRTVDRVYQGVRLSENVLFHFSQILNGASPSAPFTNGYDITTEVSVIPNARPDFLAIASRAYYDMKYAEYQKLMRRCGIDAISTFALVDP